ncbi:MAG: hypothetical protein MZV70_63165, partial [Desulfobacterales bacterium]|nr:hypothetical protein [Desulfobacterales bacterium]
MKALTTTKGGANSVRSQSDKGDVNVTQDLEQIFPLNTSIITDLDEDAYKVLSIPFVVVCLTLAIRQ